MGLSLELNNFASNSYLELLNSDVFARCLKRLVNCPLQAGTARYFHVDNCHAGDVVLFEDFSEFLGVDSRIIEFGAAYYDSFSRQQNIVEVFESDGRAVSRDEQISIFEERRLYRNEVKFHWPLRRGGSRICLLFWQLRCLRSGFQVFMDLFLVKCRSFSLSYRNGALRTLPQASAQTIAVGFLDYLCFAVHDSEGSLCTFGNTAAAAIAEGFINVHDFS